MAFTAKMSEIIAEDRSGLLGKHQSWGRVRLIEVTTLLNGAPFDSAFFGTAAGFPLIRIRDVVPGQTETFYTGIYDDIYVVEPGELLIGMDGDFNSALWRSSKALLNQRVCKVTCDERFYSKAFLAYAIPGYLAAINANTPSVTVKHLSSKTIGEIELPLPPLAEQTRIVEKLDELLSDLDAGVADLKTAQRKLAQYRQSLLKAGVEGALTADWRAAHAASGEARETGAELLKRILAERLAHWETSQLAKYTAQGKVPPEEWRAKYREPVTPQTTGLPELPTGWTWASIEQVSSDEPYSLAIGPFGSNLTVADYRESGVPLVFVRNIRSGQYSGADTKFINKKKADELKAHHVSAGDVLVTKMGDPPGDADAYPSDQPTAVITADCIKIRCHAQLMLPQFLVVSINSPIGRRQIGPITQGVAQKKVSLGRFSLLALPLPPISEQRAAIERLQVSIAELEAQENAIELGLRQAGAQRRNILKMAFSGELVPQDASDEPASLLLKRIRLERGGRDKLPKPSKSRKLKDGPFDMTRIIDVLAAADGWMSAQELFRRCGITNGASTEQIEALYAELRELDKTGRLGFEPVMDPDGRKLHDRLKLLTV